MTHSNTRYMPRPYVELTNPPWCRNAVIYEVNIRQYTPEGTFMAFKEHLPRLKELGVDILWLMPVHPIGLKNRKGTLGSYYAVRDYYDVNPEFGTQEDLRNLVEEIHHAGMHVIIDWVANHSAADNVLVEEHPEWYSRSDEGSFQSTPWLDWDDVYDFDYQQPALRKYMTDVMKYWVREFDIDGYRCDVAGFVPLEFWENLREELQEIKPVFMLAEWEARDLHRRAFDMTYAWSLWDKMKQATTGGHGLSPIVDYIATDVNTFPEGAIRMTFTDNHDKNSWNGTPYSNFGPALEAMIVLTCTINGMPLVYSGQEAGLNRSLAFFEKDEIEWKKHPHSEMFRKLFVLKKRNQALWNGHWGGEMIRIHNDFPERVLSFMRQKNGAQVVVIINFSTDALNILLSHANLAGTYKDVFSGKEIIINSRCSLHLKSLSFLVLENILT